MNSHDNTPDVLAAAGAEADRDRARADAGDGLARLRAASLTELAELAGELRCQVDDLADDALSSKPMPQQGLRTVTARLSRLANRLARAADGYTGARDTDMAYPQALDDLDEHGWTAFPDRDLDGTLPPIPITELHDRRGYRRGWKRGQQTLTLWFTGPYALAYAAASGHGRLHTTEEVQAVITAAPEHLPRSAVADSRRTLTEPFDATHEQVAEHMRTAGWGDPVDEHPCDERGVRRPNGTGTSAAWESPSIPNFRVYAWGIGDEPAHVWYWADRIANLAALRRLTDCH